MKAYILTMKTFLACICKAVNLKNAIFSYILILEDDVLNKQIKCMDAMTQIRVRGCTF